MKHEQSAPAGYRPRFAGTMKLYLVRHNEKNPDGVCVLQILRKHGRKQRTR